MKLIDKDALVAEIERLKTIHHVSKFNILIDILSFINTLEVKEVDLDLGNPEGDIGVKTIWDGDNIVSSEEQKEK